ncbi:cytochrome P450 [Pseudomonas sp. Teo4]|uniref:cytochrome P450 n=1 Tax=Pseudomonas sp. Teo4 TaxID=3064528 RepID=UPI002AB8F3A1|nr:cytochrome P450 [Pseudomonas sp. Teo4]MDZ3992560.1 Vitamin D(3) 25-hydroxylase [Pseudomonas sp. Teo4]
MTVCEVDVSINSQGNTSQQSSILLPWADEDFRANPHPWYDVLRRDSPVYLDPLQENSYVISRYADVIKYGKHHSLSSVVPDWVPKGPWSLFKASMIVKDGEEHVALRRRSNKWFTPKLANQYAQHTAAAVNYALNDMGPDGVIEAYRNLALLPAHYAMCAALGLPNDGYDSASAWMHDAMVGLGAAVTDAEEERCKTAFLYLTDRVKRHLQLRRDYPEPGMVSSWIDDVIHGEMTEQELFEGVLLFWATGTPNAAYLISGGLETFARNPEVFELWKSDKNAHQSILNELARLYNPEISFTRFTKEPLEISGVEIPANKMIRFMIASANRDPDVFPNPDCFDLTREVDSAGNLTFGIGAHQCPGMIISKAEVYAVFNTIAERVRKIELIGSPVYANSDRAASYVRLPLKMTLY